jgi:hypothetical protein
MEVNGRTNGRVYLYICMCKELTTVETSFYNSDLLYYFTIYVI